ncbi:hypothetical protein DdX_20756 [Ditylenchus destructor]|uniref:Uncharacterized protein n=1 Tax=Ditylenchus destructor TaxID=166010 RepID=A0AAD4MG29_9BILA|nr:hypothetical protein DdX_20756 [Ditylenchus destructor]
MNAHIFILITVFFLTNFGHIECEPDDALVAIKEDADPNNPPRVYYYCKKRAMLWKVYQIHAANASQMGLYTSFTKGWFDPRSGMGYLYYNSFDHIYNFVYASIIEAATQLAVYPKTLTHINQVTVGYFVYQNQVSSKAIIVKEVLIP